ncbi:hypothetical protein RZS08_43755, partial [Arthrospira platensis SPKY1]|nr:hypothetical protein [Arthrospira platensis SPKY1]
VQLKYKVGLTYDELVAIDILFYDRPTGVRMPVYYQIFNEVGALALEGCVTLCFIDADRQRPCKAAPMFVDFCERILNDQPSSDVES